MFDTTAAELIAKEFHEAYERLAPSHGYKTRDATAVPWEEVPENNRNLMIAVATCVMVPKLGEAIRVGRRKHLIEQASIAIAAGFAAGGGPRSCSVQEIQTQAVLRAEMLIDALDRVQ